MFISGIHLNENRLRCLETAPNRQGGKYFTCHGSGYRGREGVANLSVNRGFFAEELPIIREALDAGCHAGGQARHSDEITRRGIVPQPKSVNA